MPGSTQVQCAKAHTSCAARSRCSPTIHPLPGTHVSQRLVTAFEYFWEHKPTPCQKPIVLYWAEMVSPGRLLSLRDVGKGNNTGTGMDGTGSEPEDQLEIEVSQLPQHPHHCVVLGFLSKGQVALGSRHGTSGASRCRALWWRPLSRSSWSC